MVEEILTKYNRDVEGKNSGKGPRSPEIVDLSKRFKSTEVEIERLRELVALTANTLYLSISLWIGKSVLPLYHARSCLWKAPRFDSMKP